jgi:hypothetical protein
VPGILPVQNFKQTQDFRGALRRSVPRWLAERFEGSTRRGDREADRCGGRGRTGARPGRPRRHRFSLLHHEPADLVYAICHLLGLAPPQAQEKRRSKPIDETSHTRRQSCSASSPRAHPVLDGAMGTMIQTMKLDEEGYRGARFDAVEREVRGNNDLLNLQRADAIREIHYAYYKAGADIVSTNTFSSTSIAQADYGMSDIAYELNCEGARLAREAATRPRCDEGPSRSSAGAAPGPTNRTASISRTCESRAIRAVTSTICQGLRRAGAGF